MYSSNLCGTLSNAPLISIAMCMLYILSCLAQVMSSANLVSCAVVECPCLNANCVLGSIFVMSDSTLDRINLSNIFPNVGVSDMGL